MRETGVIFHGLLFYVVLLLLPSLGQTPLDILMVPHWNGTTGPNASLMGGEGLHLHASTSEASRLKVQVVQEESTLQDVREGG